MKERLWRNYRYLLLSLSCALLLWSNQVWVFADEERVLALQAIQARVDQSTAELQTVGARQSSLEAELKDLRARIAKKSLAVEQTKKAILARRNEQEGLKLELQQTDAKIQAEERLTAQRLKVQYVYRPGRLLEALVRQEKEGQKRLSFSEATYLMGKVRESDRQLIEQLRKLRDARREQAASLQESIQKQESLREQLEKNKADLELRVSDREAATQKLAAEKMRLEEILASLKAEASNLEVVVTALTSSMPREEDSKAEREGLRGTVSAPEKSVPETNDVAKDMARARAMIPPPDRPEGQGGPELGNVEPFDGPGLRAQRKRLALPARGAVVRTFGRQRHGEFSDFVFQRGIEMAVAGDLKVRAIAPAKVVFSGILPGFGKVVILDHGARSYSLYGRLGEVRVQAQQVLSKGEVIAGLPAPDRRGSNFYFEVRENGVPVNPRAFFSNL